MHLQHAPRGGATALNGRHYAGGEFLPFYVPREVAIFNAAVELANRSGQPLEELGASLSHAFRKLAENPEAGVTEEIKVLLDPDDDPTVGWQPRGAYANTNATTN